MTRSVSRALVLVFLAALALGACGKKGPPRPPPDQPNTYPLPYPNQ